MSFILFELKILGENCDYLELELQISIAKD